VNEAVWKTKLRWKDNIKTYLKEVEWEGWGGRTWTGLFWL